MNIILNQIHKLFNIKKQQGTIAPAYNFIIAAPRSGTTWLSRMLNAHPEVYCVERRLFGEYADFVQDKGKDQPRLRVTLDKYVSSQLMHYRLPKTKGRQILKSLIKAELRIEMNHFGKPIGVDKITPYLHTSEIVIKKISEYFPESKIIFLVRDGRDVLTSGVFHWFNKRQASQALNDFEQKRRILFQQNPDARPSPFFQEKEIRQWATEWKEPLEVLELARKRHPVRAIRYESLLENPKRELEDCFRFLGASTKPRLLDTCVEVGAFSKMTGGRQRGEAQHTKHVRKGIHGDWKNYFTFSDAALFEEIAGSVLREFGYEESKNWFTGLQT